MIATCHVIGRTERAAEDRSDTKKRKEIPGREHSGDLLGTIIEAQRNCSGVQSGIRGQRLKAFLLCLPIQVVRVRRLDWGRSMRNHFKNADDATRVFEW